MGPSDTNDNTPPTQEGQRDEARQEAIVDLYQVKVSRMSDPDLFGECITFLRVMEQGGITPANKHRATILFTEAAYRPSMVYTKEDFLTALKVLKFI